MSGALLGGVRVVELAQNLAGPMCAEILARLGADVIKVERPEGDDARGWGPPFHHGVSPSFLAVNADKRGIAVDLKDPQAVAWLIDLIGEADVVVQNLRPGWLDGLGLGAAALTARYPRLVYCSVWALGRTGPLMQRPGYEPMVQAFSGLMMMNSDDDTPRRVGAPILDYGTAMWAAIGVLAGLLRRQATGRGCVVDASLFETALTWLRGACTSLAVSGAVPERHPTGSKRVVPFQGFETKTGPVIIAAGNDRLFARLAAALGRPEWAADPRYATNQARVAHREVLVAAIEEIVRGRSKGEWIDLLEAAGVPCAAINTLPEALAEPQVAALGMLEPVPDLGLSLMALPLSFDGARPAIRRAPPRIGQHDAEVRDPQRRWEVSDPGGRGGEAAR